MNKKPVERRTRVKKNNELSATSETSTGVKKKPNLGDIIHFYEPFKCKNKTQKDFINMVNEKDIIIASGPAGVGKSYVAIARALELIKATNTPYSQIILSKPAVESDEHLGFIPGDIREKMEPFISSSLDIFDKLIGEQNRLKLEELKYLKIQPQAFIRGKSIDNTILLMEEAQNLSPQQMKTLLTRVGTNSKFIISGDLDQSDRYKHPNQCGLYDAINKHQNIPEIGFIEFSDDEIVRNPLISKILANYKVPEKIYEPKIKKEKKLTFFDKLFNLFK